jgi:hypothetical protein
VIAHHVFFTSLFTFLVLVLVLVLCAFVGFRRVGCRAGGGVSDLQCHAAD